MLLLFVRRRAPKQPVTMAVHHEFPDRVERLVHAPHTTPLETPLIAILLLRVRPTLVRACIHIGARRVNAGATI
jgi:hypothetical protein